MNNLLVFTSKVISKSKTYKEKKEMLMFLCEMLIMLLCFYAFMKWFYQGYTVYTLIQNSSLVLNRPMKPS